MKKIELTKGRFALVDDEDYEWLNQWKWWVSDGESKSYAIRRFEKNKKSHLIFMHKLILNVPKGMQGDHINGNSLDNQRSNLRICTKDENNRNAKIRKDNKSGYKGVVWDKDNKEWKTRIWFNRKAIYLGRFNNIKEAVVLSIMENLRNLIL